VPATIFCISVGFFAFIALSVSFLRFTMIFSFSGYSARITTISLASEAGSTDTKY
jgi:hypothetical protein